MCKSSINIYGVFFKAKEQSKTESSGFVFNKNPYFYSSVLKMLFHEKCFNCCFLFWAVSHERLVSAMNWHFQMVSFFLKWF